MADTTALREKLDALQFPVFAVLDGAQFDDLPEALLDGDFVHKPLYVDRGGQAAQAPDFERTAPQMVWLDEAGLSDTPRPQSEVMGVLLALIGEKPAAVFWECPTGGEVLYKHLRGINMVMIPRDTPTQEVQSYEVNPLSNEAGSALPGESKKSESDHDLVLFRHTDSNVMAQVLPALDAAQFARMFGPATTLLFVPDKAWAGTKTGIMLAPLPENLPAAPFGPLCFDAETIERVRERRLKARNRQISAYVRDNLPPELSDMDDAHLHRQVELGLEGASGFGISEPAALNRWAYMSAVTNGAINSDSGVKKFMASEKLSASPDRKAKQLMDALIYRLREESKCL